MCFSLAWLQQVLVWVIVLVAVVALLRLLISAFSGGPFTVWPAWPPTLAPGPLGFIGAALNIVLWAIIAIAVVYFIFMLIGCLLSFSGGFPRLR